MSELHVKVYEQLLQGEMDSHLGYEKGSKQGVNMGNSRNGTYPKNIQGMHRESILEVPRDREGEFEPVVVLSINGVVYLSKSWSCSFMPKV